MSVPPSHGKGLLNGVVAYVDIRSPFGNPAFVVTRRLISLGATVESTRNAYVTHVIFRYGDPMTKLWAEKRGLCIVAPTWVKACVEQKCRVPEACYYLKDKEDVDLADDCNRIASRNVPPIGEESISVPHSEASPSLYPAVIATSVSCSKSPRTRKTGSSRKGTHETTPLPLGTCLSRSGLSSPAFTQANPPPGWMRLPSPQQQVANLPLPLFPEEDTLAQEAQPRLPDLIGSVTLSRMPLSPDVLHFVVRNFASSATAVKKNRMPKRKKIAPLAPVTVTPSQEKKIVSKTPMQRRRGRNILARSQSSLRRQLLKSHVSVSSASDTSASKRRVLRNGAEEDSGRKTPRKKMKLVGAVTQPRRKSQRLLAKFATCVGSAMGPPRTSTSTTSKSVIVDSEISLKSPTVNICSPEPRNSLEDFISPGGLKPRRCTRGSISSPNRPIEILFSGLNAFQRQTLIALLRSSTELSKHEVTPTLNRRLCGSSGAGDSPKDNRNPKASLLAAILGKEVEALAQRWRLADVFNTRTTTHLVSTSPFPRTINLFKAVLASIPVVDMAWIVESAKAGKWLPFRRFLIPGLPLAKAAAKLQKLFSTVGCVFVAAGTSPPPTVLKELIIMGGGSVSKRAVGAGLVVGQKDAKTPSVSPKWILGKSTWIMKFRVRSNDSGSIDYFATSLAKNCVLRIRKDSMSFIIREHGAQGGAEIWCELDQTSVFPECICEGLSPEQDEIFLEVLPEEILYCLRGVSSSVSTGGTVSVLTSQSHTTVGSSGVTLPRGQTTLHNFISTARSLKIKLVRRKTPCLALEVEQASISGRSRAVWHFVPVHILPLRLWSDFEDTPDPDFDLSIFLPPVKNLRLFVDRMKHFARFLTIKATGGGDLYLEINMETLARVRLTFRGLRARDWHLPEGAGENSNESTTIASTSTTSFAATIDIRRFSQLISAQRVQPDIVQDHLVQFVMLFEHSRLKYTLPTSHI
ncbi:unnamed protein product [Taenia asiatica]|uniref:BRCT domain-containing protein n=1 Tax=Taenia asiatica TaxID=60517 RepID=A0A0R3W2S8_TAEAS|nr:unnamed protein product [Taenia asiatica]